MPIVYVDGVNTRIEVEGPILRVLPFGSCPGGEFDLTPYQGSTARLYLDEDGSLSLDQSRAHWWQLAEVALPQQEFVSQDSGEVGEDGQNITEQVPAPLDLSRLTVMVWALAEVD